MPSGRSGGVSKMSILLVLACFLSSLAFAFSGPKAAPKEITPSSVSKCLVKVKNRGVVPFTVMKEIIEAVKDTPKEVFAENKNSDVYLSVAEKLGPYSGIKHRMAVMANVMSVQAGFESSWDYKEGRDMSASNTSACTAEAGLYQTSGNMNTFNAEAKEQLVPFMAKHCKNTSCLEFQRCTKEPIKAFVHGHFMRASRITNRHWGPMVRKEINPWLSRACVLQIQGLL